MRITPTLLWFQVGEWGPELALVRHQCNRLSWAAPAPVVAQVGVRLRKTHPKLVADHDETRAWTLAALATIR